MKKSEAKQFLKDFSKDVFPEAKSFSVVYKNSRYMIASFKVDKQRVCFGTSKENPFAHVSGYILQGNEDPSKGEASSQICGFFSAIDLILKDLRDEIDNGRKMSQIEKDINAIFAD